MVKIPVIGIGAGAEVDGQIAFFIGVKEEIANKLLNATSFLECESVNGLFCTSFVIDTTVDQILSNEMTQAALLSSPEFVLVDKDVQRHAELAEAGWLYQDGQFIVPGVYE